MLHSFFNGQLLSVLLADAVTHVAGGLAAPPEVPGRGSSLALVRLEAVLTTLGACAEASVPAAAALTPAFKDGTFKTCKDR